MAYISQFIVGGTAYELKDAAARFEKQDKIVVSGLHKGDGSGGISEATAGTDYAEASHTHSNYASPTLLRTVTLTAAGWSNNAQTVTVSGVLADTTKQVITVSPAPRYGNGLRCSGDRMHGAGSKLSDLRLRDSPWKRHNSKY